MALEIFRLIGSVFVDTAEADKSLQKTDEKAEGVGQTLLKGAGTVAKWGAAVATGATVAAGALVGVANNAAGAMDVIDKGSAKIGISKQAYQEWSYVLGQNGMSIDKMEVGMKTLVAAMDGAAAGTKSAQEKFDALGLSIYDADGALKDQETMMNEAIYALADMENGTEKARLATEIFGKAGVEMMPMLNNGAEGITDLTERAHELGLVMSDEAVTAGVVLGDTMDDVKQSFSAVGNKLGTAFMPIIQTVLNLILDKMPMFQALIDRLAPVLTGLLEGLLPPLLSLAETLLPAIFDLLEVIIPIAVQIAEAILPIFVDLIQMLLPPLVEIISALLPPLLSLLLPILDLLRPILDLLQPILDVVVAVLTPIGSLISDLLTPLISVITFLIDLALKPMKLWFGIISDLLSGTVNAAFSRVMNIVNTAKNVFSGLIDFVKNVFAGNWKGAWESIKNIFSAIWDGIKNAFKIPINWIIDGLNAFIRGINKIKIPDWVPGVGGKGFSIKEIPKLEAGGVLEKGQTGFLEGNGAEAVVPLEKNKKWISAVARDMDSAMGGTSGGQVVAILTDILGALEEVARMGITLDTGALVGGLARPMDRKLGQIQAQKARA